MRPPRRGGILPDTDAFAFEPRRAALLRAAVAAGLPMVAFDMDLEDSTWLLAHPEQQLSYRERRMPAHIVQQILARDAAARMLVWVGHGHAQKKRRSR